MDGTDVIAAVALAVSFASAVAAAISLILGFREAARREEEIRLLRDEANRRDEEIGLLRQQLGEERAERLQQQRATLIAEAGRSSSSSTGVEFGVLVANAGPHVAIKVGVRLHDAAGTRIGTTAWIPPPLMPGNSETVTAHAPPKEIDLGPYGVSLEWYDGRGYQEETVDLRLTPP